jgi:predicted transposase YdaD
VLLKPVSEMTGLERWSVFLRYANHKSKQSLIQQIKDSEEGIKMGAEMLETISSDREQFLIYFSRMKQEIDHDSQLLYAEKKGKIEGIIEGKKAGKKEGKKEATSLLLYLMRQGLSADEIEEKLADELGLVPVNATGDLKLVSDSAAENQ